MTRADSDSPGTRDDTSLDTRGRIFENEALLDGDTEILNTQKHEESQLKIHLVQQENQSSPWQREGKDQGEACRARDEGRQR
jgi:hypothetical protein